MNLRRVFPPWSALVALFVLIPVPATADDGHAVQLRPGAAGSKLAPRYSPKGYKVPLSPVEEPDLEGFDHRHGRLLLGPEDTRGEGHRLVLARSVEGKAFDLLWIDRRGDGSLADDDVQRAAPRESRGNVYTNYKSELRVNHGSRETAAYEPYPIALWVAVESVAEPPAFIRYSRRGFLVGSVSIGKTAHDVVVSDGNNDAIFGTGDWWALLPGGGQGPVGIEASRKVGDFLWIGTKAYKFELEGTNGRRGRIRPFEPGITPEEDARNRDPCWDDKRAKRAAAPLAFEHDVDAAIEAARARKAHYFLDFETTWCGPCKLMDRWVYTAEDVVVAAKDIVCIKVDGDERKDLKAALKVSGFPTGILLDPAGKEIARFTGYRTGVQMVAFFAKARGER